MNIKTLIKKSIQKLGFDIIKFEHAGSNVKIPLLQNRIGNLIHLGFESGVIVDGGSHIGNWTKEMSHLFPNSKYILIEPNPTVHTKIAGNLPNSIEYTLIKKVLDAQNGNALFNIWEDTDKGLTGSSMCNHISSEATRKINCETVELDSVIDIYKEVPNLVKLDLQGYEINALQGAKQLLKQTEIFIIEFGCLEAYIGRTSINDLINLMYENSYCLYDIIDMHYRPYDNALTGGDFIFIKNSSKLRQYKGWE